MTGPDTSPDAAAWSDFWADNASGDGSGCLPERWAAIEEVQRTAWIGFVAEIGEGAKLLDLATGDGRVLRWMQKARRDLVLTGIDLAPELPRAPDGTETIGGIGMEALPFEDNTFAAVVSQFGFEYGDVQAVSAEVARVLSPGGQVGLMVHRGDGPILEHNLARQAAIGWALKEKRLIASVTAALTAPNGGAHIAAQVASALAMLGAQKFGQNSPAWEIPEAARRTVLMNQSDEAKLKTLVEIESKAANELGRIASLANACATADARDTLVAGFVAQGLALQSTDAIAEPSGRALADFLRFT